MGKQQEILYEVKGKTAVITLNLPKIFNALDKEGYYYLNSLVEKAGNEPNTTCTLIQSTGKFFSAGANVRAAGDGIGAPDLPEGVDENEAYNINKRYFQETVGARNLALTNTFQNHPKVLVIALNGPVIGLSAALVALADFIYAIDTTYLLTPFANLGLTAEGAASYTLVQRLGLSKANEALLASKPIKADDLKARGFINELYPKDKFQSTEEFNNHVLSKINDQFAELVPDSVSWIKKLIRSQFNNNINAANNEEVFSTVQRFSDGIPQGRFAAIANKARRHKL